MREDLRYFLGKLSTLFLSLFIIISLTFFLMKAIPGDPFADEQALPTEIHEALQQHYGLKDPWYTQYGNYLVTVITWDFGPSFKYRDRSVNDIINKGFPVSAVLGLEALVLALSGGILLGTVAALKANQWQDYTAMLAATLGISIPSFIMATLLQFFLSVKLGWLPVARWGTFTQSILPAVSLAAMPMAFIARLTRSNMLEVMQQEYIRTARTKGLSEMTIITQHALRNALLPLFPYVGQLAANILTGSFIIEKIFSIPGLGQWFVNSISNRDYTVIMGTTVFYSIILLGAIFIMDLLYGLMDPRITQRS